MANNPNLKSIKTSKKVTRKLSIAVGLLAFVAFIIQGWGDTWGFGPLAEQLVQTILVVVAGINIFFLGDTVRKNVDDKENENGTEN